LPDSGISNSQATQMDVPRVDFENLVNAHYEALFRFAMSLAKVEAQAADLTQQTFYLWATRGHQLRDVSKVKSWLFTTLYREFLGSRRRSNRFPQVGLEDATQELPNTLPDVINTLDGAAAVAALGEVEEVYRVPLTLFYLEEFSYKEIAELIDVPIGTVMSRLSRGKQRLRNIFADSGFGRGRENKVIPLPGEARRAMERE